MNIMTLRGHHLKVLQDYVYYSLVLGKEFTHKDYEKDRIKLGYGKKFTKETLEILNQIQSEPSQLVRLIDTPDDICNSHCKKRNENCNNAWKYDHKIASKKFGLTIRQEPYTAEQLVKSVNCRLIPKENC